MAAAAKLPKGTQNARTFQHKNVLVSNYKAY
jgi:hypothetical protein